MLVARGGQVWAIIKEDGREFQGAFCCPFSDSSAPSYIVPDFADFYLLHLTLMREYLNLKFRDIEPTHPFAYNLDQWLHLTRRLLRQQFSAQPSRLALPQERIGAFVRCVQEDFTFVRYIPSERPYLWHY